MLLYIEIGCHVDGEDLPMVLGAVGGYAARAMNYATDDEEHSFEVDIMHDGVRMAVHGHGTIDTDEVQYITVERVMRLLPTTRRIALCS